MKVTLSLILLVVACICFVLAAFGVNTGRVHIGWLGLAIWVLAELL